MTLVYFDAGGGHRAAARALESAISMAELPWEISFLNLQDLLNQVDLVRKLTTLRSQDVYNLMLEKGWTLGAAQLLKVLHRLIRIYYRSIVKLLVRHWQDARPDLVVSLVPNFNKALAESIRRFSTAVPFATILTDLADYPPHFWIERESEYLICGTEFAAEQGRRISHAPERVIRVSGMILNPDFYAPPLEGRTKQREALGLDAGLTTGLVMFGGHGSSSMLTLAGELASFKDLQLIFICGHNRRLESRLRSIRFNLPVHIEGFTREVPRFMQMSDFFIGKPGPGSISEALLMGLPVIVERNVWTLPQERFNTDWIRENNLGIVVRSFRAVSPAVEKLVSPGTLALYRSNVRRIENRAVFEIPEILARILEDSKGEQKLAL